MNIREQKGLQIAQKHNIIQSGNLWLVPSQSGKGKYKVRPDLPYCSCPDYEIRRHKCKHIFAVEQTIERTKTVVIEDGKTTLLNGQSHSQDLPSGVARLQRRADE